MSGDAERSLFHMSTWDMHGPHGKALAKPLVDGLQSLGWSVTTGYFADDDKEGPDPNEIRVRRRTRYAKVPELAEVWRSWRPAAKRSPLVMARGFEAGMFARLFSKTGCPPYVFHAEGFWIEERQAARSFSPPVARQLARLEAAIRRDAAGLIVLTSRAAAEIGSQLPGMPILVVPSSIDMTRFAEAPAVRASRPPPSAVRCCWLGSFEGRYDHDAAARFVRELAHATPVELTVISRQVPDDVRAALESSGVAVHYESVRPEEVGALLPTFDVGLLFLEGGPANRGTSPTKFPEYLAAGLAVAMNTDIGDGDEILGVDRTGVVVEPAEAGKAVYELVELLRDPLLPQRCMDSARRHFDGRRAADQLDSFLAARLAQR